jgi:exonuclease III
MVATESCRLISWNVAWQNRATPATRVQALTHHQPDVVALQEVRLADVGEYNAALHDIGLREHASSQRGGRLELLVAARWPLERLAETEFDIPVDEVDFYRKPAQQGRVRIRMLSTRVNRPGASFELHVAHVPPGSSSGWRKVDAFRGIRQRLVVPSECPRILCGDFNEPRGESSAGIETWAGRSRWARSAPERWESAVSDVLIGLEEFDLVDAFRRLHGDRVFELWSVRIRGGAQRRYDHVLTSRAFDVQRAEYLHAVDELKLSDHTPALVELNLAFPPGHQYRCRGPAA